MSALPAPLDRGETTRYLDLNEYDQFITTDDVCDVCDVCRCPDRLDSGVATGLAVACGCLEHLPGIVGQLTADVSGLLSIAFTGAAYGSVTRGIEEELRRASAENKAMFEVKRASACLRNAEDSFTQALLFASLRELIDPNANATRLGPKVKGLIEFRERMVRIENGEDAEFRHLDDRLGIVMRKLERVTGIPQDATAVESGWMQRRATRKDLEAQKLSALQRMVRQSSQRAFFGQGTDENINQ